MKLEDVCRQLAACRGLAVMAQTNLSRVDHTDDPSLSSSAGVLMWEQWMPIFNCRLVELGECSHFC